MIYEPASGTTRKASGEAPGRVGPGKAPALEARERGPGARRTCCGLPCSLTLICGWSGRRGSVSLNLLTYGGKGVCGQVPGGEPDSVF